MLEEFKAEPLHEDLIGHAFDTDHPRVVSGSLLPGIYHPYLHAPFVLPHQYGWANKAYELRKKDIQNLLAQSKYSEYLMRIEKPYRLDELHQLWLSEKLRGDDFWEKFLWVYTAVENCWQSQIEIEQMLLYSQEHPLLPMLSKLSALPDEPTLYRGYSSKGNPNSFSFTTDYKKACWFAGRLAYEYEKQYVRHIVINKSDVVFYHDGRDESEVVILPNATIIEEKVEVLNA